MAKWDNDTTIKFIQIYKQHPCLWNFRSADHKNKQMRDAAFVSIAQELNIVDFGVQDVKNKIKNLRSTYGQEVKKIQESKKSGSGLASVYVSNIKWLKEMEEVFMNDLKRKIFENLPSKQSISQEAGADVPDNNPDAQVNNVHSHVNNPDSQVNISDAQVNTTVTASTPNATKTSTTTKTGKLPQATKRTKLISNAISDLRALHQEVSAESNSEEVTAFDMFGKYVAMQLKSMSFENALMAQSRFQNILTEYAIKDHREKIASRPSSSVANHGQHYSEIMLAHSSLSNYSSQGPETPETPETESNDVIYSNPPSVQSDSIASEPTYRSAAVSTMSPMSPYADSYYQNPQSNMSLTQLRQSESYNNSDNDIVRAAMNAAFENN